MDQQKKNLLVFGYGLTVILLFIGWRISAHHHDWGWGSWVCVIGSIIVLGLTLFNKTALQKFYEKWMKVAHCIGNIISGLILLILFYGVFGVVGIVLRLIRRDLLDQRIDRAKDSYWSKRTIQPFTKEDYQRQF